MKRRTLLKNIAAGFGSLAAFPAWASNWTPDSIPVVSSLSMETAKNLKALVETLIPTTDTPGAGELGVEKFVMAMVNDCVSDQSKQNFYDVLGKLNDIDSLSASQRLEKLIQLQTSENKAEKDFFQTLKRFAIQGYQNSEYVMNAKGFQFAPGFYHGCVSLQ